MGPDTENTPEQKASIEANAIPSEQMWEITAKITVRADTAAEAEQIVDELLNEAEVVDSFEYV